MQGVEYVKKCDFFSIETPISIVETARYLYRSFLLFEGYSRIVCS